jgi:hypothetical protein
LHSYEIAERREARHCLRRSIAETRLPTAQWCQDSEPRNSPQQFFSPQASTRVKSELNQIFLLAIVKNGIRQGCLALLYPIAF